MRANGGSQSSQIQRSAAESEPQRDAVQEPHDGKRWVSNGGDELTTCGRGEAGRGGMERDGAGRGRIEILSRAGVEAEEDTVISAQGRGVRVSGAAFLEVPARWRGKSRLFGEELMSWMYVVAV